MLMVWCFNMIWPNDTIWHQRSGLMLSFAQVLSGNKSLPEPLLTYHQRYLWHSPESNLTTSAHAFSSITCVQRLPLITRFVGPTWGPPGAGRTQVGPMWAKWTLLSGTLKITTTSPGIQCVEIREEAAIMLTNIYSYMKKMGVKGKGDICNA